VALALVSSACSPPSPSSVEVVQVETHVLAARDSGSPDSYVSAGRAFTVWRRSGVRRAPVLESAGSFTLAVPLAHEGAVILRSLAGLASPGASGEARFDVGMLCPGTGERRSLRSVSLAEGPSTSARLDVDASAPAKECQLLIDVTRGAAGGRAYLVDPIVEQHLLRGVSRPPRLNLLLVTMDTTRTDALGPWGGDASTPHLDQLAASGVVFTEAHSVAFGTTPSHSSLFTGQPAARHGVYDNETALPPEMETLAERLSASGYQTAAFVGAAPVSHQLGLDQGFLLYDDMFARDPDSRLGDYARFERRADVTVDRFEAWLIGRPQQPAFAAWLHFFDPHQPYAPAEPVDGEPEEVARYFGEPGRPTYLRAESLSSGLREKVDRAARSRYLAEITFADRQLGRVIALLRRLGLFDETLVVFTTDHGENFLDRGESLAWNHAGLLPEVTRTGLVVKLPHAELGGQRVERLVGSSELACFVAESLGVEPADGWVCTDLLASLRGGPIPTRRELVLEGAHRGEVAFRTGRWLFRQAGPGMAEGQLRYDGFETGARLQLYDLSSDPGAWRDLLVDGSGPPAEQARFLRVIESVRQLRRRHAPRAPIDASSHLDALRALGYVAPRDDRESAE